MTIYDCVIIGGGFAGLSAGIYLARYNRSCLVVDVGDGRWNTHEWNENYLGFPRGVLARKLRQDGLEQALYFGAKYQGDNIQEVIKKEGIFYSQGLKDTYLSKTLILATGVKDLLPEFPGWQNYFGRSLFWCITCDGFKARGKKVVVVGNTDDAQITAMQFLNFTHELSLVTNSLSHKISPLRLKDLKKAKIPLYTALVDRVEGEEGMMREVKLDNGLVIPADFMFNQQGATPNSILAQKLGLKLDDQGYILTDNEQRTNLPFVYAAGDVTKPFSHQVVTAAHEGSAAAEAANYDLYLPEQRY